MSCSTSIALAGETTSTGSGCPAAPSPWPGYDDLSVAARAALVSRQHRRGPCPDGTSSAPGSRSILSRPGRVESRSRTARSAPGAAGTSATTSNAESRPSPDPRFPDGTRHGRSCRQANSVLHCYDLQVPRPVTRTVRPERSYYATFLGRDPVGRYGGTPGRSRTRAGRSSPVIMREVSLPVLPWRRSSRVGWPDGDVRSSRAVVALPTGTWPSSCCTP